MGSNSLYGANGGPDTKNEVHAPGVSTHARFTRRLGLLLLFFNWYGGIAVTACAFVTIGGRFDSRGLKNGFRC